MKRDVLLIIRSVSLNHRFDVFVALVQRWRRPVWVVLLQLGGRLDDFERGNEAVAVDHQADFYWEIEEGHAVPLAVHCTAWVEIYHERQIS